MSVRRAVEAGLARPREPLVEGFRGVVVAAVVAYHLVRLLLTLDGGSWGSEAPTWLFWFGTSRFAVDAFFVLAGMFVTASWLRARKATPTRLDAARHFVSRRARRILPPFWAAAAVFGGLAFFHGRIDLGDLALLATTQQYLDPSVTAAVNLPMWSLTTEIQFYVVAPLVAIAIRWGRGLPLLLAALAVSTWWAAWPDRVADLPAGLLPGRIDQFVVGAAVGVLVQRVRDGEQPAVVRALRARGAGWALVAALVALGTFHGATFQAEGEDHVLEYAVHPLAGLVLGGMALRLTLGDGPRWLAHRRWRFLGLISYSLYLTHYPLLDHGMDWFGLRDGGGEPAPQVVLAAAALVLLCVAVAVVAFSLVEAPFARGLPWKRKKRPTEQEAEPLAARTPAAATR